MANFNRIKVVFVNKKRTNKWLSEQLGCAPTTVSKWCTNSFQSPMETFVKVAELLGVRVNHYDCGYSSAGGSGVGILMVVVFVWCYNTFGGFFKF